MGDFGGSGEARMGGFAAKFRGFWVARGRGAPIQRTVDTAGVIGRKNFLKIFKKGVKTRKMGCEGCRKVVWAHLIYGVRGDF